MLGFLGALLVIISTSKYGPGISTDSTAYMYAAKSLLAGRGFIYFGYETPFIQWPPLFSTVLAMIGAMGVDMAAAARYLNSVVFGSAIVISGLWLIRHTKSYAVVFFGTMAVALAVPLLYVSRFAWSEPLFVLFILLCLFELERFAGTQKLSGLLLAAIFSAMACLTRYAGITVVLTGLLVLFLQNKRLIIKMLDMLVFGFISSLPVSIWIARNYILSSTLIGARTPSQYTLIQNVKFTLNTFASWFIPDRVTGGAFGANASTILKILVIAVLFVTLVWSTVIIVKSAHGSFTYTGLLKPSKNYLSQIILLPGFVMIYTCYLIASSTSVAFDTIDNRLLAPVCIPLLLLVFLSADRMGQLLDKRFSRNAFSIIIAGIMGIWLLLPLSAALADVRNSAQNGAGVFSTTLWHESQLIAYLEENPPDGLLYSNYPDAIYALTGMPSKYTPKRDSLREYGLEPFKEAIASSNHSYIVWFKKGAMSSIYNIEELSARFSLTKVMETGDGYVFDITPSYK